MHCLHRHFVEKIVVVFFFFFLVAGRSRFLVFLFPAAAGRRDFMATLIQDAKAGKEEGESSSSLGKQLEEMRDVEAVKKPVMVRVKRKQSFAPIETLWLEVSDRAVRRKGGLQGLSLTAGQQEESVEVKPKLLFSRVQTLTSPGFDAAVLIESLKEFKEERKNRRKEQRKPNIGHLDTEVQGISSRAQRESAAREARFQQVWNRRRRVPLGKDEVASTSEMDFFRLYDVVRVDVEAEEAAGAAGRKQAEQAAVVDDDQRLCNYMPLLREYLPAVAAQIDQHARDDEEEEVHDTEDYVYDVYAVEEDADEGGQADVYVTVQVYGDGSLDCRGQGSDSDFDSEDSNAEANPNNDYPEEESSSEGAADSAKSPEEYEYDVDPYDFEQEMMIWTSRK